MCIYYLIWYCLCRDCTLHVIVSLKQPRAKIRFRLQQEIWLHLDTSNSWTGCWRCNLVSNIIWLITWKYNAFYDFDLKSSRSAWLQWIYDLYSVKIVINRKTNISFISMIKIYYYYIEICVIRSVINTIKSGNICPSKRVEHLEITSQIIS